MYTNTLYKISLNESAYENQKINDFSTVFRKLDVYGRNRKLISEGKHYSDNISYTLNEQQQIKEMFSFIEYKLLEQYLDEASFNDLLGKAKEAGKDVAGKFIDLSKKGINGIKNIGSKAADLIQDIWEILKKLPERIRETVQFIEKILKAGISKASELIKAIGSFLSKLGDSLSEAILNLKIFNDSKYIANAPRVNEKLDSLDKNPVSNATFKYVMAYVFEKVKDKQLVNALHESDSADYSDSMRKLDNWFLNHKDEWLDKSKNNTLFRLFISGTNASGERLGFFKVLLISIIGSFLVCTLVPLIASSVFGLAGTGLAILVIACRALWVLKNVCRIIINRTLTYKQSFYYKNGVVKHSHLFDLRTILSLCIAVLTPALFMIYHDEITEWFHSLFHCEQEIPQQIIVEKDPIVIEKLIDHEVIREVPVPVHSAPVEDVLTQIEDVQPITVEDTTPELTEEVNIVTLPDEPPVEIPEVTEDNVEEVIEEINTQIEPPVEMEEPVVEDVKPVVDEVVRRTARSTTNVVLIPTSDRVGLVRWAAENHHRVIGYHGNCYAINMHHGHMEINHSTGVPRHVFGNHPANHGSHYHVTVSSPGEHYGGTGAHAGHGHGARPNGFSRPSSGRTGGLRGIRR